MVSKQEKEDVETLERALIAKAMFGGVTDADIERLRGAQKERQEP